MYNFLYYLRTQIYSRLNVGGYLGGDRRGDSSMSGDKLLAPRLSGLPILPKSTSSTLSRRGKFSPHPSSAPDPRLTIQPAIVFAYAPTTFLTRPTGVAGGAEHTNKAARRRIDVHRH